MYGSFGGYVTLVTRTSLRLHDTFPLVDSFILDGSLYEQDSHTFSGTR